MADDDKSDDETFLEFLDKVGPSWLEKKIAEMLEKNPASLRGPTEPKAQTAGGLDDFLNRALEKAEARGESLSERLEDALALMTPEQLLILRKSRAKPADPASQTQRKPNEPNSDEPPTQEPAPKKPGLAGLLKRL